MDTDAKVSEKVHLKYLNQCWLGIPSNSKLLMEIITIQSKVMHNPYNLLDPTIPPHSLGHLKHLRMMISPMMTLFQLTLKEHCSKIHKIVEGTHWGMRPI